MNNSSDVHGCNQTSPKVRPFPLIPEQRDLVMLPACGRDVLDLLPPHHALFHVRLYHWKRRPCFRQSCLERLQSFAIIGVLQLFWQACCQVKVFRILRSCQAKTVTVKTCSKSLSKLCSRVVTLGRRGTIKLSERAGHQS